MDFNNSFEIYNEDFFEKVKDFPDQYFDSIIVDPPYFLSGRKTHSIKSGKIKLVDKGSWDFLLDFNEQIKFHEKWLNECYRILKDNGTIWISGTHHNIYKIGYLLEKNDYKIINDVVLYKTNSPPPISPKVFCYSHEILLFAKKKICKNYYFNISEARTIKHSLNKDEKVGLRTVWGTKVISNIEKTKHPTQKKLEILEIIVRVTTKENDLVFDPFMGSGTTGVACLKYKRRFIGIEKEKEYFEIAKKRIENEFKNTSLF